MIDKYYNHSEKCKYISNPNYVSCCECHQKYDFSHPYCCLDECGEHEFCKPCRNKNRR